MMHDFELHDFSHSPKNVLLKALLYLNQGGKIMYALDYNHLLHCYSPLGFSDLPTALQT